MNRVMVISMFIKEHGVENIEIVPFDDAWNPEKGVKAYEDINRSRTIDTDFGPVKFNRYGDAESPLYFINDIRQEFR